MGLGLLLLESYGKENIIISEKPKITFFKKVYKKYENFSYEYIPQYFKSTPDFNRRVTVNISKSGDLIKDISLYIELPDIPLSNHNILPSDIKKFAWVEKIGIAIIKYIDLEIGGILINRHYNDYLNIYFENNFDDEGLYKIIGKNVKVLTDYTNGKLSYKLHIPLNFFFNLDDSLALPLISLSKQDVKIHIEFNDFSLCYKQTPTHYFEIEIFYCLYKKGELIKQNIDGQISIGEFVYFDISTKRVYYNKILNSFLVPTNINSKFDIIGQESKFSISPKVNTIIVEDEDYFFTNIPSLKNSYIIVNYIFLSNNEKFFFMNEDIEYLIPLVNNVLEENAQSINKNYKLNLNHPTKLLYWRAQLNSELEINNFYNYHSLPITENEEPLILSNKLIINSIPRLEIYNFEFYNHLQTFMNENIYNKGVHCYSFGLNNNKVKPSGTLNFSKIDDVYLQLNLNKLVTYQNNVNIKAYTIYYNILVIKNGSAALKFSM